MSVTLDTNALLASMAELNSLTKLALTDTDYAHSLINSASKFIEGYTKRTLKEATYTSEKYDGNGSYYLYLKQYPISSITSIHRWDTSNNVSYGTYTANSDYLYDGNRGWIYLREGFQIGVQNYQITYKAGYAALPYDVRQACALYCSWMDMVRDKAGLNSESIGGYSYSLANKDASAVPKEIFSILNKYVRLDIE